MIVDNDVTCVRFVFPLEVVFDVVSVNDVEFDTIVFVEALVNSTEVYVDCMVVVVGIVYVYS